MLLKKLHGRRSRRGIALVELAIVAPVLVILLIGLWEFGNLIACKQVFQNAVREGGRQGASASRTVRDVKGAVATYIFNSDLGRYLDCGVDGTDGDGFPVYSDDDYGDLTITVEMNANPLASGGGSWFTPPNEEYPMGLDASGNIVDIQSYGIRVSVQAPFDKLRWIFLNSGLMYTTEISATTGWQSMRDKPVVVSADIPRN